MIVTSSASSCVERGGKRGLTAGVIGVAVGLTLLSGCGGGMPARAAQAPSPARPDTAPRAQARQRVPQGAPYAVGERTYDFVDPSRTIKYPGHARQARPLVTVVRYPENARGPLPLIVFAHGFAVTPAVYWRLLRSWTQAGYVVAAPVFPLENQHAPGGSNETDLVNQPRDVSFVITHLLALSSGHHGPLAGLIAPGEIAVSGQSDGGETALAVAYDRAFLDRRIRAAAILSGAELPGAGRFYFPASSPPLLATQGTADTVNRPHFTYQFFAAAPRPKYLLKLIGAPHLPPYTSEQPQLGIVERVTTAFFARYLKRRGWAVSRMIATGNVAGKASLTVRR
jgi:dienelactone hydrolase